MSGTKSRRKGAQGERVVAEIMRGAGYNDAVRGLGQARSGDSPPDVDGTPWWIEVKRRKGRVQISSAWEQADKARTAAKDTRPLLVASRSDGKPWLATVELSYLLELLHMSGVKSGAVAICTAEDKV